LTMIRVGIGEFKSAKAPAVISTLGLGSCVGICLWDEFTKVGGLAHIMLPDSNLSTTNNFNPGKFADTAIPLLIYDMEELGANRKRIIAKIAGGAQMFEIKSQMEMMKIGKRNVEAVRKALSQFNIKIVAEDVEGNFGRSIEFNCDTGLLTVKSVGRGIKII